MITCHKEHYAKDANSHLRSVAWRRSNDCFEQKKRVARLPFEQSDNSTMKNVS